MNCLKGLFHKPNITFKSDMDCKCCNNCNCCFPFLRRNRHDRDCVHRVDEVAKKTLHKHKKHVSKK